MPDGLQPVQLDHAHPGRFWDVGTAMHAHEPTALTSHIPAQDATVHRLALLTLDEAQHLLRLLELIAAEGEDELSQEAEWFAREITGRIPSKS
ncbi:DUF6417 family protein [Streptomyces sp. NPDC046939]|uniref:DUF6417 family protein n=1 Tax=Streptomyces sp. NPDC046939 TaxID=3155376 RepID=UPI003409BD58